MRRTKSSLPGRADRAVRSSPRTSMICTSVRELVRWSGYTGRSGSCHAGTPAAKGSTPWRDESVPFGELPPRCPHCGGTARPAVVWFGESLRGEDLHAALHATACDVFLAVGTSAVVYPAAGLLHEARNRGAFTAEINLEATPASDAVDLAIQGPAEVILPLVAGRMSVG